MPENRKPLTDVLIRGLKPQDKAYEVSDLSCPGLKVKVSKTGLKTFVLKARDSRAKTVTVKIGEYPAMPLKDARSEATRVRQDLKSGLDVNAEKKAKRSSTTQTPSATLGGLVIEYEATFGLMRKSWSPRGAKSERSLARQVIERVFAGLLDADVETITEAKLSGTLKQYKRFDQKEGELATANGQASKARSYLMPVLDWANGRKKFAKLGAGREPLLNTPDLRLVLDPAQDDASIQGKRDRVLFAEELRAVLPLLKFPAPKIGKLRLPPEQEYRPIAMRFMLFTAARLDEVCSAKWRDIDRANCVWRKPVVKTTRGRTRSQDLPLSKQAFDILMSLPSAQSCSPDELIFQNADSGKLGNWDRFQKALFQTSNTKDWHRHDLRRTASSIMAALKVAPSTIEQILAHKDPHRVEGAGAAASHYLHFTRISTDIRDAQEEALSKLADTLISIEGSQAAA